MKKILLGVLVGLILIQFIRPEKNSSKDFANDISTIINVPEEVQQIIKTSCADCHSNNTKYPWYSEIAPVSWYLAQHVNEGKEHLNFSEWAAYNKDQKSHILKDLEEEIEEHKMPLKSYLILHKEAELTKNQYETILNWVKTIPSE
ncbi:MAG: cytochrome C [Lutibacter sp.]|uniref:heme-binding domain-containing protein n=1 Tax=Lutibacter sp. TaxID=1925666 RepID=UPI001A0C0117|nr:heme-binding domain-containing protein [Lutibacter sp.]NOR27347.1 cytochrome C [Lutibacter sp.]